MKTEQRISHLLKAMHERPGRMSRRRRAVAALLLHWPDAERIRFEGQCNACKHPQSLLMSFVQPQATGTKNDQESCGYYCARCQWSNAGWRVKQHG